MISKTVIVRRGEYKCRVVKMHLKLRYQQLKTITYIDQLLYGNHKLYKKYTHTHKKRNPNITLKTAIKSQEKTIKEGSQKNLQRQCKNN